MASFFDNLGQRIDQGIAGLYNRDQVVGLENQYTNQYGVQDTSGGVASDARHMSAMNNLSNTLSKSGLGIAMGLPPEFAGDMGAFGAGLINEIPALARGFNKENLGEIGEDITANFRGSFGTPNSTTAEDIYSQVFSGAVPQRFASGTPMGYGAAQASELTDVERDFPGMSTGDIIDSMNNRGPVATNIATAPQPKGMSYEQMVDLGLAGPDQDVGMTAEDLQNRPNFFGNIKNKIGSGFNNLIDNPVTKGLGTAINFARGSVPGMIMSGVGSLFNRDPKSPSYQQYSPQSYLKDNNLKNIYNANPSMINDFYDDNPDSDTFNTTRFDRAVPGSFGSFRTLAGYLNRNKNAAAALTTKKAKKEAAMQQQIKEAEARQAELNRRQSIVDAQTARGFTTSGGSGNYSSSKDHSGAGGYGGTGRASNEARSNDLGFSDIRLKDNIELVGKSPSNINIYNFTYLNDPKVYQGVMAQEVPWASVEHNSGYLMVDYSKVDVEFKRKDAFASMFTRRR